jgi:hypothetical protein
MGKLVDDSVLDAALNLIKNNATQLIVCKDTPTTYDNATATYDLATKTGLTSGDYTGPANGDTNGRKLTINQQSTITVNHDGTATHVALCGTASVLYYVTTCTSQVLTAGNTVTVPAWDIEIADPT